MPRLRLGDGRLSGAEFQHLQESLLDAYGHQSLAMMLQHRLGKRLEDLSLDRDLPSVVFRVITVAEDEGWTADLLSAARASRPDNARLLSLGQAVGLSPPAPQDRELERRIRASGSFVDVVQWRSRLGRAESQVCRVESYDGGRTRALGTGFLVGPDLVLTNFHVLEPLYGGQWSADRVRFRFDYTVLADGVVVHPGRTYGLAPDWDVDHSRYSPLDLQVDPSGAPGPDELDHALVRLDRAAGDDVVSAGQGAEPGAPARGWLELQPDPHDFLSDRLLSILQHPDGQPLKLAIDTSAVLGTVGPPARPTRVRYATLTEPGSSGSPCFDADWNLVALHHSGDPKYEAFGRARYNEGIPAQALWALLDERGRAGLLGRPARDAPDPACLVSPPHPGPTLPGPTAPGPTAVGPAAPGPSAASPTGSSAPPRQAPERPAPLDLDPFVPRPEEQLLEQALERPGAVVALHGPQGAGKSRLAREHARSAVRTAGPRSVWFVDLSGRGEQEAAARVVQHLPSSLGTEVEPEDVLVEWFADRDVLVVLDNCDDAPLSTQRMVGHLLAHCSGVSVLTTSQASWGLAGQQIIVRGLPLPPKGATRAAEVERSPAVQLFVEWARRATSVPVLDDERAAVVAEVCAELGGLPGPVRTAAAQLDVLTLDELRDEVLHGRGLPALQHVLDVSYGRLQDDERLLFRRLCVLRGPFLRTTVTAVCWPDAPQERVLSALQALIRRQLVAEAVDDPTGVTERLPSGGKYFRVYTAHRGYAEVALRREEDAQAERDLRDRHARWFAQGAEEGAAALPGPRREATLLHLRAQARDLDAALRHVAATDQGVLRRLAAALFWYWNFTGQLREAQVWLDRAGAVLDDGPAAVRARLHYARGGVAFLQGELSTAVEHLRGSVQVWRGTEGSGRDLGLALVLLGTTELERGELSGSAEHGQQAVDLLDTGVEDWSLALALNDRGNRWAAHGASEQACACYTRALALWDSLADRWGQALTSDSLGSLVWRTSPGRVSSDEYDRADGLLQRALQIQVRDRDTWGEAWTRRSIGELLLCRGRLEEARAAFFSSLALHLQVGRVQLVADCVSGLGRVTAAEGDAERGAALLAAAERVRQLRAIRQWPVEARLHERAWRGLREHLDEGRLAAAREAGQTLVVPDPRPEVLLGRLVRSLRSGDGSSGDGSSGDGGSGDGGSGEEGSAG